jgi:hypothetical protein
MTLETINTYRNRQQEILEEIDQMHQSSNWTEEMGKHIEKLDNKFSWLKMRNDKEFKIAFIAKMKIMFDKNPELFEA